jgi:pimeloyl-ACP methyl ester carboxylesterase
MIVRSGRAEIACEVSELASSRGVLLIRAGVTDRRSWHHVVTRLAPRHRCVRFDGRGYGETVSAATPGWSPVADAIAVMDATALPSRGRNRASPAPVGV